MNTYLSHHGIPGMRWGIRRFQNYDGSYTPEGRKRYLKYGITAAIGIGGLGLAGYGLKTGYVQNLVRQGISTFKTLRDAGVFKAAWQAGTIGIDRPKKAKLSAKQWVNVGMKVAQTILDENSSTHKLIGNITDNIDMHGVGSKFLNSEFVSKLLSTPINTDKINAVLNLPITERLLDSHPVARQALSFVDTPYVQKLLSSGASLEQIASSLNVPSLMQFARTGASSINNPFVKQMLYKSIDSGVGNIPIVKDFLKDEDASTYLDKVLNSDITKRILKK